MVRVAVVGVGSCCSSFAQLVQLATDSVGCSALPGVSHPLIGGLRVNDITISAAFDVDARKVGVAFSDAIALNDAVMHHRLSEMDFIVDAGPVLDGLDGPIGKDILPSLECGDVKIVDVTKILIKKGVDVVVCCLPSGASEAVRFYAEASAQARVAYINCTASPAANDAKIAALFHARNIPLLGDDLRSHVGATTVHATLLELLSTRGLEIVETYQLNVGGNSDFLNLSDKSRSAWKVASKKRALQASAAIAGETWAGPNGYIKSLGDRKVCQISIIGRSALGSEISIDLKMQVEDSPNAASVIVNAVRIASIERKNRTGGVVHLPAAFLFKSPVRASSAREAELNFDRYLSNASRAASDQVGSKAS